MHKEDETLHELEEAVVEKDLGVHVDNKLKFSEHSQNKVNTANKAMRYIKNTFKFVDEEMFLLL